MISDILLIIWMAVVAFILYLQIKEMEALEEWLLCVSEMVSRYICEEEKEDGSN